MVKKYNPFKMYGSYLGFLILGFFGAFIFCITLLNITSCPNFVERLTQSWTYIRFLLFGFVGFFVGYGVHSLFRALK